MTSHIFGSVVPYLKKRNDDDEESVRGQQNPGLFDRPAVAQEGDNEDECSGGNQDVSALLNHSRLSQFLRQRWS